MQQPPPGGENPRPPGVISLNNIQIMRPGAPIPQKSVATVTPRVIVGNPIQRPGPSGMSQEMLQNMAGPSSQHGPMFVKSDGRYQLVRVGAGMMPQARPRPATMPPMGAPQVPGQSEVLVPMSVISAQGVQTIQPQQLGQMSLPGAYPRMPQQMQQMMPMQPQQTGAVQQMQLPAQLGFPGNSQRIIKPPDRSKDKCRSFLANLLDLSSKESPTVERKVRQLIQELIDGAVEAADFCSRLERLLDANSQPCLVSFLMKSLPMLRQSMAQHELSIPGVRPPPLHVAYPLAAPQPAPAPLYTMQSMQMPDQARKMEIRKPAHSFDDKMAADDEINDVAAMGGVNLREESARILGSHHIGAQIRSCSEERGMEPGVRARLREACLRRGLAEPPAQVALCLSLALHERVRTLLARLAAGAAHRLHMDCKTDDRYEVTQDVKSQLKFLEELDRVEKRRREETEREMLLRAAKSRSKTEDPEQAKLKAKAKEMQRAEMEEVRQREANLTALQAIGPRKKPRAEPAGPAPQAGPSNAAATSRRSRLLRITLRDMLHMLENDRLYAHSSILYKAYLRA